MLPTITLRPLEAKDEAFLYDLYKRSRTAEFAIARLSEVQFEMLMRMQYAARKASYQGSYPNAQHEIIVADGLDAGQIWVSREPTQIHVVDISIGGDFQNRGIGSAVLADLIANAQEAGLPVRCSVATNNPGSLRFHQRLGFQVTGQDEAYYQLERAPGTTP